MAELRRYAVKLKRFSYTGHVGPDGKVHLKPKHKPGYDTKPVQREVHEVEAINTGHAKAVFAEVMGIKSTTQDYEVRCLSDGEEPPVGKEAVAIAAKAAERIAKLEAANAQLMQRLDALEGAATDPAGSADDEPAKGKSKTKSTKASNPLKG